MLGLLDGSPEDSLRSVVGGFALFSLVLPGIGVFIPLWFPTGTAPTRRWRWVGWMATLGVVGITLGFLLVIYVEGGGNDIDTCNSIGTCSSIGGLILILGAIVGGIAGLIVRWVRSMGVERLQMKWLVLAFLVFGIGALRRIRRFPVFGGRQHLLPAGVALVPITIGIAVLRYRLYEIDRILSRTVSYTLLVALLAGVFFGSVTLLTTILSPDSDLVTAAATLLVAGLFNPVRRRLQAWVDRRFNRSRYNAQVVIDEFVTTLRDRGEADRVVDGWVGVVNQTMQPTSVSVWVRQ